MRVGWSLIADQLSFKNLDINELLLDVSDEGEVKQGSRTIIINNWTFLSVRFWSGDGLRNVGRLRIGGCDC